MVFLYQLERGQAGGSYGLNVAAMAGLPTTLLKLAQAKSKKLLCAMIGRSLICEADINKCIKLLSQNSASQI